MELAIAGVEWLCRIRVISKGSGRSVAHGISAGLPSDVLDSARDAVTEYVGAGSRADILSTPVPGPAPSEAECAAAQHVSMTQRALNNAMEAGRRRGRALDRFVSLLRGGLGDDMVRVLSYEEIVETK